MFKLNDLLENVFDPTKLFKLSRLRLSRNKETIEVGDIVNVKLSDIKKEENGDFVVEELKGNLSNTVFTVTLREKKTNLRYTFKID